jgi:hypothetical protein
MKLALPILEADFYRSGSSSGYIEDDDKRKELKELLRKEHEEKYRCYIRCVVCGIKEEDFEKQFGKKLYRCGKCKRRLYCSRKCQKIDWPFHKKYICDLRFPSDKNTETDSIKLNTSNNCTTDNIVIDTDKTIYPENYEEKKKYASTNCCICNKNVERSRWTCHWDECKKQICSDCTGNSIIINTDKTIYPENYEEKKKYAFMFYYPLKGFGACFCSGKCITDFRIKNWPRFISLDD